MLCCPPTTAGKSTPLSNQPPGNLSAYFQWHESTGRLGTAYETQKVRSAVDTTSIFRQAFFRERLLLLEDTESTSRLRSGRKSREAGLRRRLPPLVHCHMFLRCRDSRLRCVLMPPTLRIWIN